MSALSWRFGGAGCLRGLAAGRQKALDQQERDSESDRRIGEIEHVIRQRPHGQARVQVEKIGHGAAQQAIGGVAERAADDEPEAERKPFFLRAPEPNAQPRDDRELRGEQRKTRRVVMSGEQRIGYAAIPAKRQIEERRKADRSALLHVEGPDSDLAKAIRSGFKEKVSPLIYVAGIAGAFIFAPLAYACYVIVAAWWFVPDRRVERQLGMT